MAEKQLKLAGFSSESEAKDSSEKVAEPANSTAQLPEEGRASTTVAEETDSPEVSTTATTDEPAREGKRRCWLIDSHSLIYQVFHAMPEMSSPTGLPVGAVHGFIRDIVDILEIQRPDYLICVFDAPGENFRHELYTEYKANRDSMPDDLQLQIPNIFRLLEAMGVCMLSLPGYEADDVLATLATMLDAQGDECTLVTSDKDCRQLLTDHVKMFNLRKKEVFDAASLLDTWGIRPEQVVDFQSLVGDSVDNVPGVPLIGPKAAQELLSKYDTLEGIYENLAALKGKKKENLETFKDQALLSRQLVQLDRAVPIPDSFDWPAARPGNYQADAIQELCREFGFRQLAQRLGRLADRPGAKGETTPTANFNETFSEDSKSASSVTTFTSSPASESGTLLDEVPWEAEYKTVESLDQLRQLANEMQGQPWIVLDTETTSVSPRWAQIVGLSFAWKEKEAWYVPTQTPPGEIQLPLSDVLEILRPVFTQPTPRKIGQNIKYDCVVLRSAGIELQGIAFDTMVADYLLDPGERSHGIDELAKKYLAHQTIKISELIGTGKKQKRMDEVPVAQVTPYAAEDADVPFRLKPILESRLQEVGLEDLFHSLEMPLIEVLSELEFNGIKVDPERLRELSHRFGEQIERIQTEIFALAGKEFNIDSRQQLGKILFEDLGLPVIKRTTTGPSTDAEVLEELAGKHDLPAKVVQYRQNAKLKSTYTDALQELIHPVTHRVHSSFKQDVAATGRLSSQDPNLQNIPIRTEEGRAIRSAFVPGPEGWQLLTADYSQIELRVLAHFSGDDALRQAFAENRDIHAQVAAEVYGVSLEEVSREQRRNAKAVNFGVIYGQSAFGLAKSLGIDQQEAADFIEAYFARYPGVEEFMLNTLETCRAQGYVSTISGRRRPVSGVRDPATLRNKRQRNLPERIAINTVIQGSAADIIKQAMIHVYRRLRQEQLASKMLLQIHDELVFEFPQHEQETLAKLVAEEMQTAIPLAVPLKVDVKTGSNWAQCEPVS